MSSEQKEKADGLVSDYKERLAPYVKAMKDRGFFGEAIKLKAQQDAQQQLQSEKTAGENQKSGQQPIESGKTGIDPVNVTPQVPQTPGTGVDLPSGDFMSVSKEVQPDSSDQSRAPKIDSMGRPKPVGSVEMAGNTSS